jgi:predicted RNA-binding protein with PUA-like domain
VNYWLAKSEPSKYSWSDLLRDGSTYWDGVRNYQARNNLKAMKRGDRVLVYHSVDGKQVMGIARVTKEAYRDPTTDDERWVVVDIKPDKSLKHPVTLEQIKSHPKLAGMALIRQSRLSVLPVSAAEFKTIVDLGAK